MAIIPPSQTRRPSERAPERPLGDLDMMPFGKYKGDAMGDVPASYFHWLWEGGMHSENKPVADYIRANLGALQIESPDAIWTRDGRESRKDGRTALGRHVRGCKFCTENTPEFCDVGEALFNRQYT